MTVGAGFCILRVELPKRFFRAVECVFAIDVSCSMGPPPDGNCADHPAYCHDPQGTRFRTVREFIARDRSVDSRFGCVYWAGAIVRHVQLSRDKDSLVGGLASFGLFPGSNLDGALSAAEKTLDDSYSETRTRRIVLLTDGLSDPGTFTPPTEQGSPLIRLRAKAYPVWVVGVGVQPSTPAEHDLMTIAEFTGGEYVRASVDNRSPLTSSAQRDTGCGS
jgi:hypothetical protein